MYNFLLFISLKVCKDRVKGNRKVKCNNKKWLPQKKAKEKQELQTEGKIKGK